MNRRDIPHPEISIAALFDDLTMLVFYIKDADGTFVRCNRRFEEFHGAGWLLGFAFGVGRLGAPLRGSERGLR